MSYTAQATVYQDSGISNLARITSSTGGYLIAAGVTSIERMVFERLTQNVVLTQSSLTVSTVMSTLTSSSVMWGIDATGYNFKDDVPVTATPAADTEYIVEYKVTPAAGEIFKLQYLLETAVTLST